MIGDKFLKARALSHRFLKVIGRKLHLTLSVFAIWMVSNPTQHVFQRSSGRCLEDRPKVDKGKEKNSESITTDWTGDNGCLGQSGNHGEGRRSWVQDVI